MMKFYALYSISRERWCAPFLAMDDEDAVCQVSSLVTASQDPGLIVSLDDYTLDRVAEFDPSLPVPVVELFQTVPVLKELHKNLPLPPLVRAKVQQLYKENEKEVDNE